VKIKEFSGAFLSLKVESLKFAFRLLKTGRILLTREEARRLFWETPKAYKYTLWTKLKILWLFN